MSDLKKKVIKLAYEKPELREHLVRILVADTAENSFKEWIEGREFTHPETHNPVKFDSLPDDRKKEIQRS